MSLLQRLQRPGAANHTTFVSTALAHIGRRKEGRGEKKIPLLFTVV